MDGKKCMNCIGFETICESYPGDNKCKAFLQKIEQKIAAKETNAKSELIKLASELSRDCPLSTFTEDWEFPYYLGVKNKNFIQSKLNNFDSWRKDMAIRIRRVADSI